MCKIQLASGEVYDFEKYFAIFCEDFIILPPNPKTRPDKLFIGNITLSLNLSITLPSLKIIKPDFSK